MRSHGHAAVSMLPSAISFVVTNAVTVGSLYLAQVLLPTWIAAFGDSTTVRIMPGLTLAGYAIGVALSAALLRDLTSLTGLFANILLLTGSLALAAWAPTPMIAAPACLLIGFGCSLTQRLLTMATSGLQPTARAGAIGWMIAGGLCGIVFTRACVPLGAETIGYRGVLLVYACIIAFAGLAAARHYAARMPPSGLDVVPPPSAWRLWQSEPTLRRAALQQSAVFTVYTLAWALYPHSLSVHGIAPALPTFTIASLGALAAIVSGRVCGRVRADDVAGGGVRAIVIAGFLLSIPGNMFHLHDVAMALVDIGTQMALVANQSRAQTLASTPAMRGRLAATVTMLGFLGGAIGTAAGNFLA